MKLRLDQLEPNRWNANEVTGDKYQLLVKDMREAGQREPVTVSPRYLFYGLAEDYGAARKLGLTDVYVICDGEHRYKAAVELGWEDMEATVQELTEDQAVTRFYRQQATRGSFDPLKEGQMFKYYLDGGLTQEQVVEKLGLSSRQYLTDRLALLELSPLVQGIVENLKGMVAARVKERATNETEEELQELTDEIAARAAITLRQLRPIATLPHNDQGLIIASILDTFADGGAVSVHQIEGLVRDTKARNEALVSFNAAWMAAATKNCPLCGRPPVLSGWDPAHRASNTFACAGGHSWRYDVTPEQAHVQEAEGRRQRMEEAQRRAEEAVAAHKTRDAELIGRVLSQFAEPPTLDILSREFYQRSDYIDFGDVRKAVALYLQEHPDVKLTEPLTAEEAAAKQRQEEEARRIYIEAKMEDDEHILARIMALYRDELTWKQLLDDYLELSRTIAPQDGRDVIALYLERHPEVTFPGDEPQKGIREQLFPGSVDREISAALGQPPAPDEEAYRNEITEPKAAPKKGNVYYTIKVEEFEETDYARQEDGCRFGYSYDTGQGGGAGPIGDRDSFLNTVERMVREIWKVSRKMKSYPRPSMKSTEVTVCQAAADEGLITEAEVWNVLLTYPLGEHGAETEEPEAGEDVESDEDAPEPKEEPLSLLMPLTDAELHSRLVPWVLGKVGELSDVKSIRIEGLRDREEVLLEYAEPDAKGRTKFSFRVQNTTPAGEDMRHIDSWSWTSFETRKTPAGLEVTSGKLSSAEEKDLAEIARFLDKTVYKDLDPWDNPDNLMGPTGFTLTPVDVKCEEPTPPVPDHGRGYQENQDAGEEHHEHYDRTEDLPTCPECGKQSPNDHYCTSCGAVFDKEKPQEEPAHALTDLEQKWSATATGKLGGLANRLGLEEALWLRGRETRRRALKHLDRRIAVLRLANAPTLTLEEA